MKLSLGFSPCPNDTFIFDALVNHKIDTHGLEFDVWLEDVQTLNNWAIGGKLDISKISYGALPQLLPHYRVIESGGALGKGVGPLLISNYELAKGGGEAIINEVNKPAIAIPGEHTTAHFLFTRAFPEARNKVFTRFDQIEDWVVSGKGLGVIIHENRFTYRQKGLHSWADLGEKWEADTGLPIPLGGIVVKKGLSPDVISKLNLAIQKSLAYAWERYPVLSDFVQRHAQELEVPVMKQHIELYVNDFSYKMKKDGREAVLGMLKVLGSQAIQEEVFT